MRSRLRTLLQFQLSASADPDGLQRAILGISRDALDGLNVLEA